jgi:hypothetical protein
MLIGIWDIDFFYDKKSWSYACMKLSSFHKQKGDKVFLIQTNFDLEGKYDILYIYRNSSVYELPPVKFFFDKKNRFFGNCSFLNNYEIPDIIWACRPDYTLYPLEKNKLYRSNAIQFFDLNGKMLPRVQKADNAFKNKHNLIIDECFWKSTREDQLKALSLLQGKKNISFLYPISMNSILSDEIIKDKFFSLDLAKGADLIWDYDIVKDSSTFKSAIEEIKNGMSSHSSGIGKVELAVNDINFSKALYFSGFARLNKVELRMRGKKEGATSIEKICISDLCKFQNLNSRNKSFIEFILKLGGNDKPIYEIVGRRLALSPFAAAELQYIATLPTWSWSRVRWGLDIANINEKELSEINAL